MKSISLWQPWASWIAWGLKTIETRRHRRFACLVGRRVAIHAALRFDVTALDEAAAYLEAMIEGGDGDGADPEFIRQASQAERARRECSKSFLPMGRIVATAFVSGHRALVEADSPAALCDCSPEAGLRYGLVLSEIRQVLPTTPFGRRRPGGRGVFEVEAEPETGNVQ
jgi:hypothetical protein